MTQTVEKKQPQESSQVLPDTCRVHEYRIATVMIDDKEKTITYVFYCVHCLHRVVEVDKAGK